MCPTGRAAGVLLLLALWLVWKMELLRAGTGMRPLGRVRAAAGYGHAVLTLTGLWTWDCPQAAQPALPCTCTWNSGLTAALPGALRSVTGATTGCHTGYHMRVRNVLTWNPGLVPSGHQLLRAQMPILGCTNCALFLPVHCDPPIRGPLLGPVLGHI